MNPKPVDSVATEFGPFLCGNEMTLGFVKSTLFLGTAIGCLGIGFFMDNIGRKFSLHLINFCQLLGFMIMLLAPRIEVIAVGYFILGMAGESDNRLLTVHASENCSYLKRQTYTTYANTALSLIHI